MNKLSETDIKANVITALRQRGLLKKTSVIANELRLGRSSNRADLAILGDEFIGIEIKSERDTLRRLTSQLDGYMAHFDRVVVVLASKHLLKVDTSGVAGNVEFWEVDATGNFRLFMRPRSQHKALRSPLALLTQQERRSFEARLAVDADLTPEGRNALERAFFREAFERRFARTSAQFWHAVGRKKVRSSDLDHLSRFFYRRQKLKQAADAQARKWEDWHAKADAYFAGNAPN